MYEKRTSALKQDDLLTGHEAAALLPHTSYARLMRWARERKVPYVEDPGGRRFFERADIEKLMTRVPARNEAVLSGGGSGVRPEEASPYVNSLGVA